MSIIGLSAATDGRSHLVLLEIVGNGPALDALLPCSGWRPFQCDPGARQSLHPTPVAGMTIVLSGCMEIGVGGGALRDIALRAGDMLLVLDTTGEGHSTALTGNEKLRVAGVTFSAQDWPAIRDAFIGWPADMHAP